MEWEKTTPKSSLVKGEFLKLTQDADGQIKTQRGGGGVGSGKRPFLNPQQ